MLEKPWCSGRSHFKFEFLIWQNIYENDFEIETIE